jgi:hypothetical protein
MSPFYAVKSTFDRTKVVGCFPEMLFFIVKSKTDCSRNDKNVVISKLDSLQCPLNILRCYLEEAYVEINTIAQFIVP